MLHRARLGGVGGRQDRGIRLVVDQHGTHPAPAEFMREHEPGRAATNDDDVGLDGF